MFWYALRFIANPTEGRVVESKIIGQYHKHGNSRFEVLSDCQTTPKDAAKLLHNNGCKVVQVLPSGRYI